MRKAKQKQSKQSPAPPQPKRQKLEEDAPEYLDSLNSDTAILDLTNLDRPFKNPDYAAPKKFKNLKQIATAEKGQGDVNLSTYWNIESPPSLRPQKKYCDVTGLEAPYTDPKSGLRYHNVDVYQFIKTLNPQYVSEYLKLRNAAVVLK